ncbi:hypothetical protein HKX48_007888 [Thoreauomyces humboldtii]|nr:hypothetical protein HKX48_007888 [Thoreauomyces humboldtii]
MVHRTSWLSRLSSPLPSIASKSGVTNSTASKVYRWTVVGAGPAGIATVGKLLDNGIQRSDIAWIDPHFDVGLVGRKWRSVWSNTVVSTFTRFLKASPAFRYLPSNDFAINSMDPNSTCQLRHIADPLQKVTETLSGTVATILDSVRALDREEETRRPDSGIGSDWTMDLAGGTTLRSRNVVLAIGSKPRTMPSGKVPILPVEHALDIDILRTKVAATDTVAVFGSSHSAVMIVRDLLICGVKGVVNFYQSPLLYAVAKADGTFLHDNTGLKGKTAEWAKHNIDDPKRYPSNLQRFKSTPDMIARHLPSCSKVIYAIGFQQDDSVKVSGFPHPLPYDQKTGFIASGLYGVGIGFPERGPDAAGNMELKVGMWKFVDYLGRVVPKWIAESNAVDTAASTNGATARGTGRAKQESASINSRL